jgi:hypothetical protein
MALILLNVWVWPRSVYFAETIPGGIRLHLERMRFRRLLLWLQHCAETFFDFDDFTAAAHLMPSQVMK